MTRTICSCDPPWTVQDHVRAAIEILAAQQAHDRLHCQENDAAIARMQTALRALVEAEATLSTRVFRS